MTTPSAIQPATTALVGTAGYLLASVAWGLNIPLTGALLKSFDPFWLSPWRQLLSAVFLGACVLVALGRAQLRVPITLARMAGLGAAVAGFLVLFNLGLALGDPLTAAAVIAGSPVYVAVVNRVMTGAGLERGFWGATTLTLLGTGIALSGRAAGGAGLDWRGGELLIVGAIGCWTVYTMLSQRWFAPGTPQLRRTYVGMVAAFPWLLLAWALARALGLVGAPNLQPSTADLLNVLVGALFCSAIATVAWNTGVARLGIQTGAIWQNTVPVFAVLITLLFYGVQPSAAQVLGGAVVLAGVLWMQWQKRATAAAAPKPDAAIDHR